MSNDFACLGTPSRPVPASEQKQLEFAVRDVDEPTEFTVFIFDNFKYI